MTIRVALVGCGAIARRSHVPALKNISDVDVVAFASRSLASAEAAAGEWGTTDAVVSDDWRKVVARDDIDAVDICSPNSLHHEQTVAAAQAGKHVLVEKPIACTVKEADAMIAAAGDGGVVLHVAHNVRYLPVAVAAHRSIARVGKIVGVRAAFGHAGPRGWAPDATWFFDTKLSGGGALIDLGIHAIDLLRFVTGLDATEVTAVTLGEEPAEDAAQVAIRFSDGAIGSVHASWVARPAPDFGLTVFGHQGTMHVDARSPLTFRPAEGDSEKVELPGDVSSPFDDFVRAIRGEPSAQPATADDGRAALAIVCAAYESARTRKTVSL
ncbi:MAG: Gfo/Idh/MocA family oxidoreductase [Actinomycetota bacterium]